MPSVTAETVRDTLRKYVDADDFHKLSWTERYNAEDTLLGLTTAIDANNATEISIFLPLALDILEVHIL